MRRIYYLLLVAVMAMATTVGKAQSVASVTIAGSEKMTFGPSTDEAYANEYSLVLTDDKGANITEEYISTNVNDFKVTWDIEGFQTVNDQPGQYCDSYGAFAVNGAASTKTVFNLRDVPMNFYGRMTATITYNGQTLKAEKYVVALGNLTIPSTQVLPLAGYPKDLSAYDKKLAGYNIVRQTYGNSDDLIIGGWCTAGSDTNTGVLMTDNDGTMFVRSNSNQLKKSHVITQGIASPSGQLIFRNRLRFNNTGAVVTLTGGYPFWSSSRYTCPVSLAFTGKNITLNGTALTKDGAAATFTTGKWYDIVLSADKSSETCYALVYDTNGTLLGQTAVMAWAETSNPTYFSIGMGNSNTGSVDMATYEAFTPTADAASFTLTASKSALSVPDKEQARITAAINDANGYPITQPATWTVMEEDMQQYVIITPDEGDSHSVTITLAEGAEAGNATIQANIGGNTTGVVLSLVSMAESIRFSESTTSISIPMDEGQAATTAFSAIVINGEGTDMGRTVTLAAYDKDGNSLPAASQQAAITFNAATGTLSVTAAATPTEVTIVAKGNDSNGKEMTKSVKVNIHGMNFDFGADDEASLAAGYTAVTPTTTYGDSNGYGIASGTPTAGGTASATDAKSDYLEGDMQFKFKVKKGDFYKVEVTYQGVLSTARINDDLAGYTLGTQSTMTTETYTIPATRDFIDLHLAADATNVARIAQVSVTKMEKRQKRAKRVVHHIGDSTSANSGSWAHRLKSIIGTEYPELAELCDFQNNGRGGRNLSTYYTQGMLAGVLLDIYPDDVVMLGNMGTNGMGSYFESDVNYYLNAAEALGAKVMLNSYTPHGAVSNYSSGYNKTTNTFDSYRRDSYDGIVRKVAGQRLKSDENFIGFVEIGRNADLIFNAYVKDYAANGYASADAAAQAIIGCFKDHNHYDLNTLACDLMLGGYKTSDVKGIVAQLVKLLKAQEETGIKNTPHSTLTREGDGANGSCYTLTGQLITTPTPHGVYIINGKKVMK